MSEASLYCCDTVCNAFMQTQKDTGASSKDKEPAVVTIDSDHGGPSPLTIEVSM